MRDLYKCDLCGSLVEEKTHEDKASRIYITTHCYSQNPLGDLGYGFQDALISHGEICQRCQRNISTALAEVLTTIRGVKR